MVAAYLGGNKVGSPAHAGIDRCLSMANDILYWFPRTRGDRPDANRAHIPYSQWFPRTRGDRPLRIIFGVLNRCLRFPRTRGDRPKMGFEHRSHMRVPPHTRG